MRHVEFLVLLLSYKLQASRITKEIMFSSAWSLKRDPIIFKGQNRRERGVFFRRTSLKGKDRLVLLSIFFEVSP